MVITGLKRRSEAEQVVDKVINEIREIGINLTNPKISIENIK
jgi:TATA-box binding protein (TBP) (component of TFIID and TFIIIB)